MCGTDIFLAALSILFPPIGVWVKRGICSADSLINLALCCLGFLPGLLHTWYIIYSYPDPTSYEPVASDSAESRVTYYYVAPGAPPTRRPHQQPQYLPQQPQHPQGYGTVAGSQPSAGQFPGQQAGAMPFQTPKGLPTVSRGQEGGEGSAPPPPSYQDAVKGDHKVQSHD
ncbi:hypothetical protein W97_00296 [Coniosporium apollinis CBS 100218]|uniref:Stress response RCI peptide n=1 Tax=Coniosporium apollinis (strain CBS 100218) TaxID=1168221 RepID=R7YGS5_CONA1|nr:uncharacterized protein W97_00296 [Coniosporium apollinis CBS 100218]EON61085.1 hypothetical protein W97_00296 [Coniosporium apollinis CBS 100218]